jgi:hypothetical protein
MSHINDCKMKENCKDLDNKYCCEEYRQEANNKCFVGKKCPWNCCK